MRWGRKPYFTQQRSKHKWSLWGQLIHNHHSHVKHYKYNLKQLSNEQFRRWTEEYNPQAHQYKHTTTRHIKQHPRKTEVKSESASQWTDSLSYSSALASIKQSGSLDKAINDLNMDIVTYKSLDLSKASHKISSAVANDSYISSSESESLSESISGILNNVVNTEAYNHRKTQDKIAAKLTYGSLSNVISSASSKATTDLNYDLRSIDSKINNHSYYIPNSQVDQLRNELNSTKSTQASEVNSLTRSELNSVNPESTGEWYPAYYIASINASMQMQNENYLKAIHPAVSSANKLRDYYASCSDSYNAQKLSNKAKNKYHD